MPARAKEHNGFISTVTSPPTAGFTDSPVTVAGDAADLEGVCDLWHHPYSRPSHAPASALLVRRRQLVLWFGTSLVSGGAPAPRRS